MCQAVRRILLGDGPKEEWSRRAAAEIEQALEETNCVAQHGLVIEVEKDKGRTVWWTFAGLLANSQLAGAFISCGSSPDNLSITISQVILSAGFRQQFDVKSAGLETTILGEDDMVKFQDCVPAPLLAKMHKSRSTAKQA